MLTRPVKPSTASVPPVPDSMPAPLPAPMVVNETALPAQKTNKPTSVKVSHERMLGIVDRAGLLMCQR